MPMMYIKSSIWSGFEIKNWIEAQFQSSQKLVVIWTVLRCIFVRNFNWWRVMAWTSSKWGKFWLWSSIWPWRPRSIVPQNNRNLNQGLLHLWSKFGDPSLNGWWIIARTSSWLTDTWTHTHIHTQATTIPEGQNWPRVMISPAQELTIKMSKSVWNNIIYLCYAATYFFNALHTSISPDKMYMVHKSQTSSTNTLIKQKKNMGKEIPRKYIISTELGSSKYP